ncbi:hypothetical protein B1H10_08705 [candidate division KSB1 bacterium 4484_188]|nr:MAG: hypothetical protein B1H10_08705 [candidate division KSB1 bacterium 4484_188]
MEIFCRVKPFSDNTDFHRQREKSLRKLDIKSIDAPIREIISAFSRTDFCFTMQSCYGHFVHQFQTDIKNTEPLPQTDRILTVEYRIAYLALCIENNRKGRALFDALAEITKIDTAYIQFGCADWFWRQQVNSYVLQVEPERFKYADKIQIDYREALRIEEIRNRFWNSLAEFAEARSLK